MRYDIRTGIKNTKSKIAAAAAGVAVIAFPTAMALTGGAALADSTVVVTPTNQQGWHAGELRDGATYSFVTDTAPGAPLPPGALELTTPLLPTTAQVQYLHDTLTPLSEVNTLSYSTRQVSGPAIADPSYQLPICAGGIVGTSCVGFTTLVYEPYQHGVITPNIWQSWDVGNSPNAFWSSRNVNAGGDCVLVGSQGPPTYSLANLKALCPNAVVVQYGVDVGSNNPGYVVHTDAFNFNGTTYNFELFRTPQNKDECKNGGWMNVTRNDGSSFKNQGDCIQYVNTGK